LAHLTLCFFWMGDRDRAVASGERALAIASGVNDFPLRVLANHRLGQAYFFTGNFRRAAELFRWNIEKLEGRGVRAPWTASPAIDWFSRVSRLVSGYILGDFASAIDIIEEGVRVAESAQHPYSTVGMYRCAAMPAFLRGGSRTPSLGWSFLKTSIIAGMSRSSARSSQVFLAKPMPAAGASSRGYHWSSRRRNSSAPCG